MKRVHVFITGNVQGIFFRAFVSRNAHDLELKGWVKNTGEQVEAVFEGDDDKIKEMLELCHQGPSGAKIERVEYKEELFKKETGFRIIY
ncbi:MAG TPA: acylphosphatase [Nanoarchaeota archaeon]|nr:acylphosphatase [Nanoarchaeota archaeon]